MPSQTPMEKAQSAYNGTIERGRSVTIGQFAKSQDCALEEAITAYLAALPEDKETVDKVRDAILHAERFGRDRAEGALRALTGTGR